MRRALLVGLLLLFAPASAEAECQWWVRYATATTLQGIKLIALGKVDFKANPTLAAGDVKISLDGGAEANLATLPDPQPDASTHVRIELSSSETTAKVGAINFIDQTAPKEWEDQGVIFCTYGHASAFLPNIPGPAVAASGGFLVVGTGDGQINAVGGKADANVKQWDNAAVLPASAGRPLVVTDDFGAEAEADLASAAAGGGGGGSLAMGMRADGVKFFADETLNVTGSVGLTASVYAPAGQAPATYAWVTVENNDIRWRITGAAADATAHYQVAPGAFELRGAEAIAAFRALAVSGTAVLRVSYGR